jgi:predicted DNA-binding transcriptional regulator YafY
MEDRLKKTDRILKIWAQLANNPAGYTVSDLARRFEVNARTVYRDLVTLESSLNVPLHNDKTKWKISDKGMLPPVRITLPEAVDIFLAARLMLRYSHRYDPNINATFTRLGTVLPPALGVQVQRTMDWMQKLPKDENYIGILSTVAEAWVSQRRLKVLYRTLAADKATERMIEPYYIEPAAFGQASYVIGYCCLKKEIRTFKMERIESAELMNENYTIPQGFDANKYFGSAWGIVAGEEMKTIKLKITNPEIMRIMRETVWHPSQKFETERDGSLTMKLRVADTHELVSWILGWGGQVEVLEPAEIRDAVRETVMAMGKIYRIG